MNQDLRLSRAIPETEAQLVGLFDALAAVSEEVFFHPHPFTPEQAALVANYRGKDFYGLAVMGDRAIGYGMLRGWDEGYEVPSLGISIHPDFRGVGIGLLMMEYLHAVASLRGCDKVRLRVNKDNERAKRLYEKLGYEFEDDNERYFVGHVQIKHWRPGRNT